MQGLFQKVLKKITAERVNLGLNPAEFAVALNAFIDDTITKEGILTSKEIKNIYFKGYNITRFEAGHNFIPSRKLVIILSFFFAKSNINPGWFMVDSLYINKNYIDPLINSELKDKVKNQKKKEKELREYLNKEVLPTLIKKHMN